MKDISVAIGALGKHKAQEVNKSNRSEREIQSLLSFAEKTVKHVREPHDDFSILQGDSNRHREVGKHRLELCVGKITIGPYCTSETLGILHASKVAPRVVIQLGSW